MQNQTFCSKCQASVPDFLNFRHQNQNKSDETFKKSQNCQPAVVSWPLKVARLPGQCQRLEAKVHLHHEWPPGELPEQNFARIHFSQTFITHRALFFTPLFLE